MLSSRIAMLKNQGAKLISPRENNMYVEQILKQNLVAKTNLHQETRSELKLYELNSDEVVIPDYIIALTPVGFVIIWATIFLMLSKMRSAALEKINFHQKPLHKVPCKNCHFFANNHYLKCSVQPSIVLTEQAMHCSDYCPKNSQSSHLKD